MENQKTLKQFYDLQPEEKQNYINELEKVDPKQLDFNGEFILRFFSRNNKKVENTKFIKLENL